MRVWRPGGGRLLQRRSTDRALLCLSVQSGARSETESLTRRFRIPGLRQWGESLVFIAPRI